MLLELIASIEGAFLSASWMRRSELRRRQTLLGESTHDFKLLFLDQRLRKETANSTKLQVVVAQKLAAVCRRAVHTQAFELFVLKLIQSGSRRMRQESEISQVEVIL